METNISEEEIAVYRLPECIEYFEEAPILQFLFVRFCLRFFGPNITRMIAERFHFEKSKYRVETDEQIRERILRQSLPKLFTPTPIRLTLDADSQIPVQSIPYIIKSLYVDDASEFREILEAIRIHLLNQNLQDFFQLSEEDKFTFEQQFNDIYMAHCQAKESDEHLKSRCKDLFANYALSSHPHLMIHHCENSAFIPYLK